jgi:hypothetical protein
MNKKRTISFFILLFACGTIFAQSPIDFNKIKELSNADDARFTMAI